MKQTDTSQNLHYSFSFDVLIYIIIKELVSFVSLDDSIKSDVDVVAFVVPPVIYLDGKPFFVVVQRAGDGGYFVALKWYVGYRDSGVGLTCRAVRRECNISGISVFRH